MGLEWRPVLVEGLHADHRHCHVVGPQVKDREHREQTPHQTRGERYKERRGNRYIHSDSQLPVSN